MIPGRDVRPHRDAEAIRLLTRAPREVQREYRVLIEVLGRPGEIGRVDVVDSVPPAVSLAAGLADVDVAAAVLDPDDRWADPFALATGARSSGPAEADLVVVVRPLAAAVISMLRRGDALNPERGARVFASVDELSSAETADGIVLGLSGPGVVGERRLSVRGLDAVTARAIADANAGFPAGVDLFLVAPDGGLVGVPRSSTIRVLQTPQRRKGTA